MKSCWHVVTLVDCTCKDLWSEAESLTEGELAVNKEKKLPVKSWLLELNNSKTFTLRNYFWLEVDWKSVWMLGGNAIGELEQWKLKLFLAFLCWLMSRKMSRREQSPLQVSNNLSKAVTCHCQRRDKLRGNWEFTLLMLAKHLGQSIDKVDNGKHFPAVTSGCSAQKKNYFGFQSLERTTTSAILIKNFLSTTKAIVHCMLPS